MHNTTSIFSKKTLAGEQQPPLETDRRRDMLAPGSHDFDEVLKNNRVVIDKTLFIEEFITFGGKVSCILRPRRFGKSMNLSMLKSFLSLGANAKDFDRFAIAKNKEFTKKHCGKYPVVYLSFKDCRGTTTESTFHSIWSSIRAMIRRHKKELPEFFSLLTRQKIDLDLPFPPKEMYRVENILKDLSQALHDQHKESVIILIDEYDAPLNNSADKPFFEDVSNFLGNFYSAALKDNSALQQACLVGILEIRGAGILSGFNNVTMYSVAKERFSKQFGFTEDEIRDFLGDDSEKTKMYMEWYDGYRFGVNSLINPYSFMNSYRENEFEAFWAKSAAVGTLASMIGGAARAHLFNLVPLLKQESSIPCSPLKSEVQYRAKSWSFNSALHYLVLTGYLTYFKSADQGQDSLTASESYLVKIPNREIRDAWLTELAIVLGDETMFRQVSQERFREILTSSFFKKTDLRKHLQSLIFKLSCKDLGNENSYHNAMFGALFVAFSSDRDVDVISNRESGHGFYDIVVHFKSSNRCFLFELKKCKSEKTLEKRAKQALEQIQTTEYGDLYKTCDCIFIGIAFFKKKISDLKVLHVEATEPL